MRAWAPAFLTSFAAGFVPGLAAFVAGCLALAGAGGLAGAAGFDGAAAFCGATDFGGVTGFGGAAAFCGATDFGGVTDFGGAADLGGATDFGGAADLSGATGFGGAADFGGATGFGGSGFGGGGGGGFGGITAFGAPRGAAATAAASWNIRTRSKPSAAGRYVQIFGHARLMASHRPPRRVVRRDRHVQMKRHAGAGEVHPLRHRFEVVDRFAGLDFDEPGELLAVRQHEVRKKRAGADFDGRHTLIARR